MNRQRKIILLAFLLIPTTVSSAHSQDWTQLDLPTGANTYLAMSPADTNLLILSTLAEGLWRSEDGGNTWDRASTGLERANNRGNFPWPDEYPNLYASDILFHPFSCDTVFALMDNSWLYRSVDAGRSWLPIPANGIPDSIDYDGERVMSVMNNFLLLPDRPGILYATFVHDSLYKSVDGGLSWTALQLDFDVSQEYPYLADIVFDPGNTSVLYAFGFGRFFCSRDDGLTWESMYDPDIDEIFYIVRHSLTVNPDDGLLYAAGVPQPDFGGGYAVIASSDSGRHWERLSFPMGDPDGLHASFVLNSNPQGEIIYTGFESYFICDQGETWVKFADTLDWQGYFSEGSQLTESLVFNPMNENTVYAATWCSEGTFTDAGFVWRSIDGGDTFQLLESPVHRSRITKVYSPPDNPDLLYAAGHTTLWKSESSGQDWEFLKTGAYKCFGFYPGNSDVIYHGMDFNFYRSLDGGHNWEETMDDGAVGIVEYIAVHPSDSLCLFVIARPLYSPEVYRSLDGGVTWDEIATLTPADPVPYLSFAGEGSDAVFIRTGTTEVYKSEDRGTTWTLLDLPVGSVDDIILSTESYGFSIISGDSLFRTNDGVQYDRMILPGGVATISNLYDNSHKPGMFSITTDLGLYYTMDQGENWTQLPGSEEHNICLRGVAFDADDNLYIGTTNDGIWKYDGGLVSVNDSQIFQPRSFELLVPYPNPFNAMTTIRFGLPEALNVKIQVYNIMGRLVTTLADEQRSAGWQHATWDATAMASGTYFLVARLGQETFTQKLTVIK